MLNQLSDSDKEFIDNSVLELQNVKQVIIDDNSFIGQWYDEQERKGVNKMDNDKVYNADNLPEDAEVISTPSVEYEPIDPSETYTVEVLKADLRDNPFFGKDPANPGNKYNLNFEFAILDDGDFYGRRIWDSTSLVLKPTGKRGATKLYKIVAAAIKAELDWLACGSFAPEIKTLYKNLQEQVVGKQLKVAIENTVNPDTKKTKTKVVSYNMVKKELPKFDAEKAKAIGEAKKAEAVKAGSKKDGQDETIPF